MKKIVLIILSACFFFEGWTQVGISDAVINPDGSALVEVRSSSKGVLLPRLSMSQRRLINTPANGLMIFDTDYRTFFYFDESFSTGSDGWSVLNSWYFRDHERDYNVSKGLYERDVIAHSNIESMSIGTQNPQLNTVSVVGNVAVGAMDITAPVNGLAVDQEIEAQQDVIVADAIIADEFTGFGTMPIGGIIMWSGDVSTLADGWELCDGGTVNGVTIPDLREKFIVSEGTTQTVAADDLATSYSVSDEGGEHSDALTIPEMPIHNHGGLAIAVADHTHTYTDYYYNTDGRTGNDTCLAVDCSCCDKSYAVGSGITDTSTGITAIELDHSHTIASEGLGSAHENRPPYHVLAFLIRVK